MLCVSTRLLPRRSRFTRCQLEFMLPVGIRHKEMAYANEIVGHAIDIGA